MAHQLNEKKMTFNENNISINHIEDSIKNQGKKYTSFSLPNVIHSNSAISNYLDNKGTINLNSMINSVSPNKKSNIDLDDRYQQMNLSLNENIDHCEKPFSVNDNYLSINTFEELNQGLSIKNKSLSLEGKTFLIYNLKK